MIAGVMTPRRRQKFESRHPKHEVEGRRSAQFTSFDLVAFDLPAFDLPAFDVRLFDFRLTVAGPWNSFGISRFEFRVSIE